MTEISPTVMNLPQGKEARRGSRQQNRRHGNADVADDFFPEVNFPKDTPTSTENLRPAASFGLLNAIARPNPLRLPIPP